MTFALVSVYNPETFELAVVRRKVRCLCTEGKSLTMQFNYVKRFAYFTQTDLKDDVDLCPVCDYYYYYKI
jgi:hypothetical protein